VKLVPFGVHQQRLLVGSFGHTWTAHVPMRCVNVTRFRLQIVALGVEQSASDTAHCAIGTGEQVGAGATHVTEQAGLSINVQSVQQWSNTGAGSAGSSPSANIAG